MVHRFFSAILVAAALATVVRAQALPGKSWAREHEHIQRLTVRVEGPDSRCQAGIIVGRRDSQVFVMTAQSALLGDLEPPYRLRSPMYDGSAAAGKPKPLTARLLDQSDGIAAFAIDDVAFASWVGAKVRFDLLGDDRSVIRQDQIYFPNCQDLARAAPPTLQPVMRVQNARIAFQGGDIPVEARESYIGAPLIEAFGNVLLVVGIVTNVAERSEAQLLTTTLPRMKAWGAHVLVTPPSTKVGCTYRVVTAIQPSVGLPPVLFSSNGGESRQVKVETAPDCPWSAFADAAPWIAVSATSEKAGTAGEQVGPGVVSVRSTRRNPCDASFRRSSINVAGQVLQVGQDNTSC